MTAGKRALDLGLALILGIVLLPVIVVLSGILLMVQGRPIFYVSERMMTPDRGFPLVKFRSMAVVQHDSGVSGGDKAGRITPVGRLLRRTRADEFPQLWNILRGDMSFVGPRPPLRRYVDQNRALYTQVLQMRPGVTGLATLVYHRTEDRILSSCTTTDQTEQAYVRRCIPRKARIDILYARHRTLCFDLILIWRTGRRFFRGR